MSDAETDSRLLERTFGWWDMEACARHLGHADFLRERIDGRVGQ